MSKSRAFDGAIVGLPMEPDSSPGKKTYVDAASDNTGLASGGALDAAGPIAANGTADGKWQPQGLPRGFKVWNG